MKKNKPDAWDLFHSMFEDGEEVVIITDEEEFFYGFLKTTDIHCVLEKSNKNPIEIEWDEVRFISHDGFPVKKLRGADGSALITYLDTTDTQKAIREALEIKFGVCDLCSKKAILHKVKYEAIHRRDGSRIEWRDKIRLECNDCNKDVKVHQVMMGDPWLLENIEEARLFNSGNSWKSSHWLYEETILMKSNDGANAMLWDIETIYHFE